MSATKDELPPGYDKAAEETVVDDWWMEFLEETPSLNVVYRAGEAAGFKRGFEAARGQLLRAVAEAPISQEAPPLLIEGPKAKAAEPVPEPPKAAAPPVPPPLPLWSPERDEVLTDGWQTGAPDACMLRTLNQLAGPAVLAADLEPRARALKAVLPAQDFVGPLRVVWEKARDRGLAWPDALDTAYAALRTLQEAAKVVKKHAAAAAAKPAPARPAKPTGPPTPAAQPSQPPAPKPPIPQPRGAPVPAPPPVQAAAVTAPTPKPEPPQEAPKPVMPPAAGAPKPPPPAPTPEPIAPAAAAPAPPNDEGAPLWSADRDDILRDAWVCWVPYADIVAELNKLPGPAVESFHLARRADELHCGRDDGQTSMCRAAWSDAKAKGMGWDDAIGFVYDKIAAEEERRRALAKGAKPALSAAAKAAHEALVSGAWRGKAT